MLHAVFNLFYPRVCAACGNLLYRNEKVVCSYCYLHLPRTGYHNQPDNEAARVFWGRLPLVAVTSYLFFRKGSKVQNLLHRLKYQGATEIGTYLGNRLGEDLCISAGFSGIDLVVPVPLHPAKQRLRGYNQSEFFAKGIAEVMQLDVDTANLARGKSTETQTRKHRMERWDNVGEAFRVNRREAFSHRHILLVDDVLTTGATLEACSRALLDTCPGARCSIATIAFAQK